VLARGSDNATQQIFEATKNAWHDFLFKKEFLDILMENKIQFTILSTRLAQFIFKFRFFSLAV
jgi:hypothetical protein